MKYIITLLFLIGLLVSCAELPPTPFETGAETQPLGGCVSGRERGVDC